MTPERLAELRDITKSSTRVVSWYPRSQYEGGANEGKATVRGPFGRWFMVTECRAGDPVADPFDDAKYAAAAMNSLPELLDEIERLNAVSNDLAQETMDLSAKLSDAREKRLRVMG